MSEANQLSDREREILEFLATGATNKEIARSLNISKNTVKVHLSNIYAKLDANSRTEASLIAMREGLIKVEGVVREHGDGEGGSREFPELERGRSGFQKLAADTRFYLTAGLAGILILGLIGMVMLVRPDNPLDDSGSPEQPGQTVVRWRQRSGLPEPRSGVAVVAYKDAIYAIGGEAEEGVVGSVDRYDIETGEWVSIEEKPLPVADAQAAAVGGLIYVPGGRTQSGEPTDIVEVYDPQTGSWDQRRPLPTPCSGYALVSYEGQLYLFGGWAGDRYIRDVYAYDPDLDQWVGLSPMNTARGFSGATVAGDAIFVIGGFDGEQPLSLNAVYVPEEDVPGGDPWDQRAPLPTPRYAMATASVADIIHIIGGKSTETALASLKYFPQRDEWQTFEQPYSRDWSYLGVDVIETDLHLIGGLNKDELVSTHLSYQAIFTVAIPFIQESK